MGGGPVRRSTKTKVMSIRRRSVISGIGVLSPLGTRRAPVWEAILAGTPGVKAITAFDASSLPVRVAGTIADFDAKAYLEKKDRKQLRMMARPIQLAVAGAWLALEDCKVDKTTLDKTRFGVLYGSCMIPSELPELAEPGKLCVIPGERVVNTKKWGFEGIPSIQPLWMLKYLPNMLACQVSILHDAQGPNNTITENDVAGIMAFGESLRILERDRADFFLVGGAESKINPLSLSRQCLFETLSKRNDDPEGAHRPFDRDREGTVLSEGSAVVVLEEYEHAKRRGAEILAEVGGFSAGFDRARDGKGLARVIRQAMAAAGVGPGEIDHISSHAQGAPITDAWEAAAYREVFCGHNVPVHALKGQTGNMGCASGILELATAALALSTGIRPATINCPNPDPDCGLVVTTGHGTKMEKPCVVKVSLSQLGQVCVVVLKAIQ